MVNLANSINSNIYDIFTADLTDGRLMGACNLHSQLATVAGLGYTAPLTYIFHNGFAQRGIPNQRLNALPTGRKGSN